MTLETLKNLSIQEIFNLEYSTYYQGMKWDYEYGEDEDEDGDDDDSCDYQSVIRLVWLEQNEICRDSIYVYYDNDEYDYNKVLTKDEYSIILDELTLDIYIFDSVLLCDGVQEGFFSFDDYEICLNRVKRN